MHGNLIKHYDFDFPPVGLIDVLSRCGAPSDAVFYILDIKNSNITELPYQEITNQSKQKLFVILSTHEGASHDWFDKLITKLISECGVPADHVILRTACLWDPDSPVKNIHTIVEECSDFLFQFPNVDSLTTNTVPLHHYVCLNRRHKWQRYELVKQILDQGLERFGTLSYVSRPPVDDNRFPIILDGTLESIDRDQARSINNQRISKTLFNVITETAYEPDPDGTQLTYHHRPGMTEKTYKCFAWAQIPVWLAPYQAVACYRQLGFDVFDDVVDHGYDLEPDPVKRISMVVDQIQRIVQYDTNQLAQMKIDLQHRFRHNILRMEYFGRNHDSELAQWKMLFLDDKSNYNRTLLLDNV
jgi:hypothetical protein